MHDDRGISNVELGWILWSAFILSVGALLVVVAVRT